MQDLNEKMLSLQPIKPSLYISKLVTIGPYIDEFISRFVCERCGKCEEIGGAFITQDEIIILAQEKKISPIAFMMNYTECNNENRIILKQPCPFYKDKNCLIHDKTYRPRVCRMFPINTALCTDGIHHLAVRTECKAGIEFLKKFEIEKLAYEPVINK